MRITLNDDAQDLLARSDGVLTDGETNTNGACSPCLPRCVSSYSSDRLGLFSSIRALLRYKN